ncbi:glycoside hydrolase family 43 protein [Galbibacter sp.]|jgi:hypothetical protein|uniref:glycoside hydrolase family 43 protein n=1 Tax=Galbibacter sp. TaxID=2918471 RepID=UPI003A93DB57
MNKSTLLSSKHPSLFYAALAFTVFCVSCNTNTKKQATTQSTTVDSVPSEVKTEKYPVLVSDLYTADPSAHVFENKIYIYPSHDWDSGVPEDDLGNHFNMNDYHVYSMDSFGGPVKDHGKVLELADVKWAKKQLWAPDAAEKDGTYYFYFPAKDSSDIFRLGVATGPTPSGPFKALDKPIANTYSIDPSVFKDGDDYYMYFGGIWGGQLQRWDNGTYKGTDTYPEDDQPALTAKIAKLSDDMVTLAEEPKDVIILDKEGKPLLTGDNERRFFEAAWVHKYNGKYYFSYSTGDTHNIAYGIGDSPYGPFTYQGVILKPVLGWTNHHSIAEFDGQWYLFFHDSSLSGGKTYLRSMKMAPIEYNADGTIITIDAMVEQP